jgi:hypothetical protein
VKKSHGTVFGSRLARRTVRGRAANAAKARGHKVITTMRNSFRILAAVAAFGAGVLLFSQTVQNADPIRALTFTLAHRELTPSTLTVKPGLYLLRLRNGMIAGDVGFTLTESSTKKNTQVPLNQGHGKGYLKYRLQAGAYDLSVDGFPQWKATITVK